MCWDGEIFVGDGTYTPLVLFWGLSIVSHTSSVSSLVIPIRASIH